MVIERKQSKRWCQIRFVSNLMDALGQYPPLYTSPYAADLITYMDIEFGPKGPHTVDGIVWYSKERKQYADGQKNSDESKLPPA